MSSIEGTSIDLLSGIPFSKVSRKACPQGLLRLFFVLKYEQRSTIRPLWVSGGFGAPVMDIWEAWHTRVQDFVSNERLKRRLRLQSCFMAELRLVGRDSVLGAQIEPPHQFEPNR